MKQNDQHNEHDDLFNELRAANPYLDEGSTPTTKTSASARFEEITMQAHETTPSTRRNIATVTEPWWRRPMVAAPSALALVAILVVGVFIFSAVTAPSAYALVNEAAQTSASFDSGKVTIDFDLREVPDDAGGGYGLEYRYDGDDFHLFIDGSAFGSGGEPMTIIEVDGATYSQIPGMTSPGQFVTADAAGVGNELLSPLGLGVDRSTISPDSIVGILEGADDFAELDDTDGVVSYRGTIATSVISEIGTENLPTGLSLFAEGGIDDLPKTLGITATVKDGLIQTLVVDVVGDTPSGYTDATVTTTFSELGEPQNIVAPSADQIVDFDPLAEFAGIEGMEAALEVLDELEARRPGLCAEVTDGFDSASDPETFEAQIIDFLNCLDDEGEPEAAEAFAVVMGEVLNE